MAHRKSNNRFVEEEPREGWAFFEKTNTWRRTPSPSGASPDHFPKEWGDWVAVSRPKGWQPDENTRLNLGSSLHAASATPASAKAGSGGGMKTGAGGKASQGETVQSKQAGQAGSRAPRQHEMGAESAISQGRLLLQRIRW